MTWIKCSDRLPEPYYDWMLVACQKNGTGEPCPWYIARYAEEGWEFHGNFLGQVDYCPDFSDTWASMGIDEITHWMEVPKLPKEE